MKSTSISDQIHCIAFVNKIDEYSAPNSKKITQMNRKRSHSHGSYFLDSTVYEKIHLVSVTIRKIAGNKKGKLNFLFLYRLCFLIAFTILLLISQVSRYLGNELVKTIRRFSMEQRYVFLQHFYF